MHRKINRGIIRKSKEVEKSTEALLDIPWYWRHEVEIVYIYIYVRLIK